MQDHDSEQRLLVAAMVMQGMISNLKIFNPEDVQPMIVHVAVNIADALISEVDGRKKKKKKK